MVTGGRRTCHGEGRKKKGNKQRYIQGADSVCHPNSFPGRMTAPSLSRCRRKPGSLARFSSRVSPPAQTRAVLLDAFGRVPDALLLADVDDLANVVGVVGADVGYEGGRGANLGVVGGFHNFFPFG
jgi:hypothetical protein